MPLAQKENKVIKEIQRNQPKMIYKTKTIVHRHMYKLKRNTYK